MNACHLGRSLALGACCLPALAQGPGFGVQGGVVLAKSYDLRKTTGDGLPLTLGIHYDLPFHGRLLVRPRIEYWLFPRGLESTTGSPLSQGMETRVRALAYGGDCLYRLPGTARSLAAGVGLYLIRWSVNSQDWLSDNAGDTAATSGKSHWNRQGLSVLANWRLTPRLEAEVRMMRSHYGYENLRADVLLGGVSWHF